MDFVFFCMLCVFLLNLILSEFMIKLERKKNGNQIKEARLRLALITLLMWQITCDMLFRIYRAPKLHEILYNLHLIWLSRCVLST